MRLRTILAAAVIAVLCCITMACGAAETSGASVSGCVWLDSSSDGERANRENLLNRAEVTLERVIGATTETVATVTTGRDGAYAFTGLEAGEYCLAVKLPSGHQFTLHGKDSFALPASGRESVTPNFTLAENEVKTFDIGATKYTARVSLSAFEDVNENGGRMDSEPRVRDVAFSLMYEYEGKSYLIATETTNKSGECRFENLSPAVYYVSALLPDNYLPGPLGTKVSVYYNCFLPSQTNQAVTAPFELKVKGNQGLSLGMVKTGAAEGEIWLDLNNDSARNSDDGGCADAQVRLVSPEMGLDYDVSLNGDGSFIVNHVMPGNYLLSVTLPEGMMFAENDSAITSESREGTWPVTVLTDGVSKIPAIGATKATALSVFVYHDNDVNGINSEGDTAYEGALVRAYRNGALISEEMTNAGGEALLTPIRGGALDIVCTLQAGDVLTVSGDGNDFYSPRAQGEMRIVYDVPNGQTTHLSAGTTKGASLEGVLYMSKDNSGVYQENSERLSGFTVLAINESGEIAAQAVTDETGVFALSVLPASHFVRVLFIDPYIAAPYNRMDNMIEHQTQENGDTPSFDPAPNESVRDIRIALFAAGEVDGYVVMNEPDAYSGLEGIEVTLLDEYGAPVSDIACDTTDENGFFYIKGVLPGTYSVQYAVPHNMAFTSPMTDRTEIESQPFVISAMTHVTLPDVAAVRTGTISGHIRHMTADGALPLEADILVVSENGESSYETRTLDDGEYMLAGLRPGNYNVTVTLPEGYLFNAAPHSIVPVTRQNVATASFAIGLDESIVDADVYASLPASMSGRMYFDMDNSGALSEMDAMTGDWALALVRGGERYDLLTDDQGAFDIDTLPPGDYLLTTALEPDCILVNQGAMEEAGVWQTPVTLMDGEMRSDVEVGILRYADIMGQIWNMDGTSRDVAGLTVQLLTGAGAPVASAVTDQEGRYAFDSLLPGEYMLDTLPPAGCLFARAVDATARHSAILGDVTGHKESVPFVLGMGEKLNGCDIGIGAIGGLGDLAWLDENGNGMQDIGERVMPGIEIALFQYGELVAQTITDVYGRYEIDNLYPGSYVMQVTMHRELKAAKHQEEFPLVASILPEEDGTTVTVDNVIVTSGKINRACDIGFALRKKNVYPDAMNQTPATDWRPYSERPAEAQ